MDPLKPGGWRGNLATVLQAPPQPIDVARLACDEAAAALAQLADLARLHGPNTVSPHEVIELQAKVMDNAQLLITLLRQELTRGIQAAEHVGVQALSLLKDVHNATGIVHPAFERFASDLMPVREMPVSNAEVPPLPQHWQEHELRGAPRTIPKPKVVGRTRKHKRGNEESSGSVTQKAARTAVDAGVQPVRMKRPFSSDALSFIGFIAGFNSPMSLKFEAFYTQVRKSPTQHNIAEFAVCGFAAICRLGANPAQRDTFAAAFLSKLVYLVETSGLWPARAFIRTLIAQEAPPWVVETLLSKNAGIPTLAKKLGLLTSVNERRDETAEHQGDASDWRKFLQQVNPDGAAFLPADTVATPLDGAPELHNQPSLQINDLSPDAQEFIQGFTTAGYDFTEGMKKLYLPFDFMNRKRHLTELLLLGSAAICGAEDAQRATFTKELAGHLFNAAHRRLRRPDVTKAWHQDSNRFIEDFFGTQAPRSVVQAFVSNNSNAIVKLRIRRLVRARLKSMPPSNVGWLEFLKSCCTQKAAAFLATLLASAETNPPQSDSDPVDGEPSMVSLDMPPDYLGEDVDALGLRGLPVYQDDDDLALPDSPPDSMFGKDDPSPVPNLVAPQQAPPAVPQGERQEESRIEDILNPGVESAPKVWHSAAVPPVGSQRPSFGSRIEHLLNNEGDNPALGNTGQIPPVVLHAMPPGKDDNARRLTNSTPPFAPHPQEEALRRLFTQEKKADDQ